jgi:hypothetical protein
MSVAFLSRHPRYRAGSAEQAMLKPDIHHKRSSRGRDLMITEEEPLPSRNTPAAMDFQAPLHTPFGTAIRTSTEFWGPQSKAEILANRRTLLPPWVLAEHDWDRNPRECGRKAAAMSADVYADGDPNAVSLASGATLARSVDVRELSNNRCYFFLVLLFL